MLELEHPHVIMHGVVVRLVYFLRIILILLLFGIRSAQTLRNVTVDSNSPLFLYSPMSSWTMVKGYLDAGGQHMVTQDLSAYASIQYDCKLFGQYNRR